MKKNTANKRKVTSNRFFQQLRAEFEFMELFELNYPKRAKYDLIMLALEDNKI